MNVLVVAKNDAQSIRDKLTKMGLYDNTRKVEVLGEDLAIPVVVVGKDVESAIEHVLPRSSWSIRTCSSTAVKTSKPTAARELCNFAKNVLVRHDLWTDELSQDVPGHWEKHDDLAIFPIKSFQNQAWSKVPKDELWPSMAVILKAKRLAKKSIITDDKFRSPNVEMLLGNDVWATRKENGICYTWNITKSMFSVGNITEKQRIAQFDCKGQTVVDLFAGIGYFALTYLIYAQADHVYACEWNPEAVKAILLNLNKNNMQDKCTVLEGDNRQVCPVNIADHVNLGLIPTSSMSYEIACKSLKQDTGGILHIHGNVRTTDQDKCRDWQDWCDTTRNEIQTILGKGWTTEQMHLEPVKSFAPKVHHLVLDLKCKPTRK